MKIFTAFVFFLLLAHWNLFGQVFSIDYPAYSTTNSSGGRVSKVVVEHDHTKVIIEIDGQKRGQPWVSISRWIVLMPFESYSQVSDFRNFDLNIPEPKYADAQYLAIWKELADQRKAAQSTMQGFRWLITELENGALDTRYSIKARDENQKFYFALRFDKLPPGVEDLVLMELIEDGWEWVHLRINNPDTSPKTDWDEPSLKSHWEKNGVDPVEGIYENTVSDLNSFKYKLAVLKKENGYELIYLSGAGSSVWKIGDVKAQLTKTASANIFKTKWYMSDKTVSEDLYITFEKGLMKSIWTNGEPEQLYLKLYPVDLDDAPLSSNTTASGSGFALTADGYILTNSHVIQGMRSIKVRGIKGVFNKALSARLVAEDRNNDIAILKIDDNSFSTLGIPPYTFTGTVSDVGSSVYALGYPLRASMGDEVKLTNGIISSKTGFQGDITSYQLTVPVQPGNSGGPLFDSKGNIVAIINAKHAGAENASYGVKTNYILNLIQSLDENISIPSVNSISSKTLSDQVKFLKEFVYIIEGN